MNQKDQTCIVVKDLYISRWMDPYNNASFINQKRQTNTWTFLQGYLSKTDCKGYKIIRCCLQAPFMIYRNK